MVTSVTDCHTDAMKVEVSVMLSDRLLRAIADHVDQQNRSAFIEEAAWGLGRARRRAARDRQELATIAAHADALNRESDDVLEYQDNT